MFESPDRLVLGLATGIVFGFFLQKGRVAKYQVILGQLLHCRQRHRGIWPGSIRDGQVTY